MAWLLLSIFTNSALLLILKGFSRYGVNTLHGIVVNYLTAGLLGILLSGIAIPLNEIPSQDWNWVPPVLGTLFISVFFLLAKTAQTMGVSTATVANKMSVVIPVAYAVVFYHEDFGLTRVAGMVLTLVAVYLASLPSSKAENKKPGKFWLPVLVFIGSGIIDALVNESKQHLVTDRCLPLFLSLCFLSAFSIGFLVVVARMVVYKERIAMKSIGAGIILGLPNYFSIYGMTRALGSNVLPSSALYPLNNIGIVMVAALGALAIFREKLSAANWIGLGISLAAIALMAI
jgi:drug/metabolite transporter (DMT)-like permease